MPQATDDRVPPRRRVRAAGLALPLILLALLVAVNAVAIWGILAAREAARREAASELELETAVHARSLEAILASLRGDLLFLRQSPPLARELPAPAQGDPMARRWQRLDVEGSLLLFLEAHPPVVRLVLERPGGAPVVAGRSAGAPVVLPPERADAPVTEGSAADSSTPEAGPLISRRWPLGPGGEGGSLEATVSLPGLLRTAAPGLEDRLAFEPAGAERPAGGEELTVRVPIADDGWEPPLAGALVRRESRSRLVRSVEALAGRYRTTVVLNLAVVGLTLVLGGFAFRQIRRAERLAAETEHQLRLREVERRLMHSERLASVGRLAAGIAHEINNPLEGMANYLSLLERRLEEGDAERARDLAPKVAEGLERAAEIVRRVLSLSSPEHGVHEPLDLSPVVADAVAFVAGSRAFPEVTIRFAGGPPVEVVGNRTTLGQLFLNLLLNACQARPGGGEVEVGIEVEAGAGAGERGRAVVTVTDRGPGLPAEARDHLFEPFFSTRGSTGLGLAVCHGIVTDHGGEIEADDRPGGGAVFSVRLPLAAAEPAATDRAAPETTDNGLGEADRPAAGAAVGVR